MCPGFVYFVYFYGVLDTGIHISSKYIHNMTGIMALFY